MSDDYSRGYANGEYAGRKKGVDETVAVVAMVLAGIIVVVMVIWFFVIELTPNPKRDDVRWVADDVSEDRWVRTGICREIDNIWADGDGKSEECQEVFMPFPTKKSW